MIRVYIAGLYSYTETGLLGNLENIRKGIKMGIKVLKLGFAPFVPFLDFQFSLITKISINEYYNYSMSWLEASDIVLVISNHPDSKGVNAEIKRAIALDIPVVYSLNELCKFYKKCPKCGTILKNQYKDIISFFCPNEKCKNFLNTVRFE